MGQPGLREEVSQKQVGLHICKDLVQFCFRGHVSNIFFPPLFRGAGEISKCNTHSSRCSIFQYDPPFFILFFPVILDRYLLGIIGEKNTK